MVEIMNQSNQHEMLQLPKNIRQIGLPEERRKIYVEDYVVTYMNQLAAEHPNQQSAAILLGFHTKHKEARFTFVNGAIGIPEAKVEDDQISFGSELWELLFDTMKKYFPNSEIVGWCLTRPGKSLGINEKITKIHVDQFPGKDKTLFMMDPMDKEEAFFVYEGGRLMRQKGYYIYYERNEDMQNYMVELGKGRGSEELLKAADLKKRSDVANREDLTLKVQKKNRLPKVMGTVAAALLMIVAGMNVMNTLYMPEETQMVGGFIKEEPLTISIPEETSYDIEETEPMESVMAQTESSIRYTVQKGDTLVNIAIGLYDSQDYVDMICKMNAIDDPDLIYEGMVLELP